MKKHLFFHTKAVLGVKYGGQNFFGQNPGDPQVHGLLSRRVLVKSITAILRQIIYSQNNPIFIVFLLWGVECFISRLFVPALLQYTGEKKAHLLYF